jgi:superfamily II DNA or RNA helicase
MTTMIRPREYQCAALAAAEADWSRGILRPGLLLPTGSGKTVTFAFAIVRHFQRGGRKVIVIAHRRDLVSQAYETIAEVLRQNGLGHLRVGVVQGARDATDADVVIASLPTLERGEARVSDIIPVDLVIYDEVHHSVAPSSLKVLRALGIFTHVRFLGVTATLERGDKVGLGGVIQHVAYQRDLAWMVQRGYLVPHATREIRADTPAELADAYRRQAGQRQGMVFSPNVKSATAITSAFNAAGITAALVTGETPDDVRKATYSNLRARRVQVLVNVSVGTEGFDLPQLEVVVIDRNVGSHGLYIQMVGRVLRPSPGKTSALVLVLAGKALEARQQGLGSVADLSTGSVKPAAQRGAQRRRPVKVPAGHAWHLQVTKPLWGRRYGILTDHKKFAARFTGSEAEIRAAANAYVTRA